MKKLTNLKLKVIDFRRRNKKVLIIMFIIAWLLLFLYNMYLKNKVVLPEPSTNYKKFNTVMDSNVEVPEKYQEPINNVMEEYMKYCNSKEYSKAYDLLTNDCKKKLYPTLEQFSAYIDEIFDQEKIYNIQAYSIVGDNYIFKVRILNDIMETGTTDGYNWYEEKFILKQEDGKMKISIGEYIGDENIDITAENEDIIIDVISKSIDYETETYTVKLKNKTDNYIVLYDRSLDNEILLDLGQNTRKPTNLLRQNIYLNPGAEETVTLRFDKFYDNGLSAQKLIFGQIRVLEEYNYSEGTTQENLDNAIKLYGLEVKF